MNGYIKRSAWISVTLLVCLMLVSTAQSASFDCAKAQTKVEKLICADPITSALDSDLGKAYQIILAQSQDSQKTVNEQQHWLRTIRNICQEVACLKNAYSARLEVLSVSPTSIKMGQNSPEPIVSSKSHLEGFVPLIRESTAVHDRDEVFTPEAKRLLDFMEEHKLSVEESSTKRKTAYNFRKGVSTYFKIDEDVYIVTFSGGMLLADIRTQQLRQLFGKPAAQFHQLFVTDVEVEVEDNGYAKDGTGWMLARNWGISNGWLTEEFVLITYFGETQKVRVSSTSVVSESSFIDGTDEDWCGPKENPTKEGITGKFVGREWKDIDNNGFDELVLSVEEMNCSNTRLPPLKRQRVFAISKGQVTEIR